jgi:hypothetical protein
VNKLGAVGGVVQSLHTLLDRSKIDSSIGASIVIQREIQERFAKIPIHAIGVKRQPSQCCAGGRHQKGGGPESCTQITTSTIVHYPNIKLLRGYPVLVNTEVMRQAVYVSWMNVVFIQTLHSFEATFLTSSVFGACWALQNLGRPPDTKIFFPSLASIMLSKVPYLQKTSAEPWFHSHHMNRVFCWITSASAVALRERSKKDPPPRKRFKAGSVSKARRCERQI